MKKNFPLTDSFIPGGLDMDYRPTNHPMQTALGRAVMMDMMNRMKPEEERVAPDKRGCETIFARAFLTYDMGWDFPLIARDFLKHEAANIEKYKDLSYGDDMPMYSNMEEFWKRTILHAMFRGFREGSAYCKDLLQYLFKTYYKSLYKIFKKFSVISFDEVLSLSEADDEHMDIYLVSVILCMAEVFDVKLKEDCDALYLMLDEKSKECEVDGDVEYLSFPDGLVAECKKQIEEMFGDDLRNTIKKKFRAEKFTYKSLQYFGFPDDFILTNKEGSGTIYMELSKTLALLKMTYPNREFSADEILLYSNIYDAASAITNSANQVYDNWIDLFNLGDDAFYEENEVLFEPSKIPTHSVTPDKVVVMEQKPVEMPKDDRLYSQNALLKEIELLRGKLHVAEKEKKTLLHELQETKRSIKEQEVLEQEVSDYRSELAALRSHLYHFTEYDEPAEVTSLEMMVDALKKKKITIVGGHINWVQKMNKTFPDWNFISPNVSVSNNSRFITGADFVYFFTDTLSHSVYNTFMQVVREKEVPFGYIHGVNIDANVKQMWEEIVAK